MITVKNPIMVMATFLWIGFVCAISFMEAWLKFTAPGVTISIGLNIGRLVFSALNKAEWVFALAIIVSYFPFKPSFFNLSTAFYLTAVTLLILQTLWVLPALDARAELYITAQNMAPSNLHWYYVAMEIIKVSVLAIFGLSLFNENAVKPISVMN